MRWQEEGFSGVYYLAISALILVASTNNAYAGQEVSPEYAEESMGSHRYQVNNSVAPHRQLWKLGVSAMAVSDRAHFSSLSAEADYYSGSYADYASSKASGLFSLAYPTPSVVRLEWLCGGRGPR